MVSSRMIYRAMNSSITALNKKGTRFAVWNPEYGATRIVTVSKDSLGRTVFRSNGWYNENTGRTDSYIVAAKIATGTPITS